VKHAQDSNPVLDQLIGCNIWRADDDKLSCSSKPADPAAFGKVSQATDGGDNSLVDSDRGGGGCQPRYA